MYELRVLTGLHRGAALPLIGQEWKLGSEKDADLALCDPGVQPKHCHLIQLEQGWAIEGKQGKVTDSEGHRVDKIEHIPLNASFAINDVWLSIVDANTPWPEGVEDLPPEQKQDESSSSVSAKVVRKSKNRSVINFTLGFLSAGAIVVTSTWASLSPSSLETPRETIKTDEVRANTHLQILTSLTEVQNNLHRMIRERELDSVTRIESNGTDIFIKGVLDDKDLDKLSRMLDRFHTQFYTTIEIHNQTTQLSINLPFNIVQITSGPMGSVITSTGRRLFVGDELDGIRLISVSNNKVIFRGKQEYELAW